jgi:hypothetical protein
MSAALSDLSRIQDLIISNRWDFLNPYLAEIRFNTFLVYSRHLKFKFLAFHGSEILHVVTPCSPVGE